MATQKSKKKSAPAKAATKAKKLPKTGKKAAPKKTTSKKSIPKKSAKKQSRTQIASIGNPIVHWEIQSQDPKRLHDFYANALGWEIDANDSIDYAMVTSSGNGGIDGGIGASPQAGSRVVVYAAVHDIRSTLESIEAHGGRVVMPRTDVGPVIMALYIDPEGNLMGLVEA